MQPARPWLLAQAFGSVLRSEKSSLLRPDGIYETRQDRRLQAHPAARVGVHLELDGVPAAFADEVVGFEELLRSRDAQGWVDGRESSAHVLGV